MSLWQYDTLVRWFSGGIAFIDFERLGPHQLVRFIQLSEPVFDKLQIKYDGVEAS